MSSSESVCRNPLNLADENNDGFLDRHEFILAVEYLSRGSFLPAVGQTFDEIPYSLQILFEELSCECLKQPFAPMSCCGGTEAAIDILRPDDTWFNDVCWRITNAVQQIDAAPRISPAGEEFEEDDIAPRTRIQSRQSQNSDFDQCQFDITIADEDRNNLLDQREYVLFIDRLSDDDYSNSNFEQLPQNLITNFDSLKTGEAIVVFGVRPGQFETDEQTLFLMNLCINTVSAIAGGPSASAPTFLGPSPLFTTPDPTPDPTFLPISPTFRPTSSPLQPSPTIQPTVDINRTPRPTAPLLRCYVAYSDADQDENNYMDKREYVIYVNQISATAFPESTYFELPSILHANFDALAESGRIPLMGSKPGSSPTSEQQDFLERLCQETNLAISEALLLPPDVPPSPTRSPFLPTPPVAIPTPIPTPQPTTEPTPRPSAQPTPIPTSAPTTDSPSLAPIIASTPAPSREPTTSQPSEEPTWNATPFPTNVPTTASPVTSPVTPAPTPEPTIEPTTGSPVISPVTPAPSPDPTFLPTMQPSFLISSSPTETIDTPPPSVAPIAVPSAQPTFTPTITPTPLPTFGLQEYNITTYFVLSNSEGISVEQILADSQETSRISSAYDSVARNAVQGLYGVNSELLLRRQLQRRLVTIYQNGQVDNYENVPCPASAQSSANCTLATGIYALIISDDENQDEIILNSKEAVLAALASGQFDGELVEEGSPFTIVQDSFPTASPTITAAPSFTNGGDFSGTIDIPIAFVASNGIGLNELSFTNEGEFRTNLIAGIQLFAQRTVEQQGRENIQYVENSTKLEYVIDIECPDGAVVGSFCQTIYGLYEVEVANADDDIVRELLIEATTLGIQNGILEDSIQAIGSNSEVQIEEDAIIPPVPEDDPSASPSQAPSFPVSRQGARTEAVAVGAAVVVCLGLVVIYALYYVFKTRSKDGDVMEFDAAYYDAEAQQYDDDLDYGENYADGYGGDHYEGNSYVGEEENLRGKISEQETSIRFHQVFGSTDVERPINKSGGPPMSQQPRPDGEEIDPEDSWQQEQFSAPTIRDSLDGDHDNDNDTNPHMLTHMPAGTSGMAPVTIGGVDSDSDSDSDSGSDSDSESDSETETEGDIEIQPTPRSNFDGWGQQDLGQNQFTPPPDHDSPMDEAAFNPVAEVLGVGTGMMPSTEFDADSETDSDSESESDKSEYVPEHTPSPPKSNTFPAFGEWSNQQFSTPPFSQAVGQQDIAPATGEGFGVQEDAHGMADKSDESSSESSSDSESGSGSESDSDNENDQPDDGFGKQPQPQNNFPAFGEWARPQPTIPPTGEQPENTDQGWRDTEFTTPYTETPTEGGSAAGVGVSAFATRPRSDSESSDSSGSSSSSSSASESDSEEENQNINTQSNKQQSDMQAFGDDGFGQIIPTATNGGQTDFENGGFGGIPAVGHAGIQDFNDSFGKIPQTSALSNAGSPRADGFGRDGDGFGILAQPNDSSGVGLQNGPLSNDGFPSFGEWGGAEFPTNVGSPAVHESKALDEAADGMAADVSMFAGRNRANTESESESDGDGDSSSASSGSSNAESESESEDDEPDLNIGTFDDDIQIQGGAGADEEAFATFKEWDPPQNSSSTLDKSSVADTVSNMFSEPQFAEQRQIVEETTVPTPSAGATASRSHSDSETSDSSGSDPDSESDSNSGSEDQEDQEIEFEQPQPQRVSQDSFPTFGEWVRPQPGTPSVGDQPVENDLSWVGTEYSGVSEDTRHRDVHPETEAAAGITTGEAVAAFPTRPRADSGSSSGSDNSDSSGPSSGSGSSQSSGSGSESDGENEETHIQDSNQEEMQSFDNDGFGPMPQTIERSDIGNLNKPLGDDGFPAFGEWAGPGFPTNTGNQAQTTAANGVEFANRDTESDSGSDSDSNSGSSASSSSDEHSEPSATSRGLEQNSVLSNQNEDIFRQPSAFDWSEPQFSVSIAPNEDDDGNDDSFPRERSKFEDQRVNSQKFSGEQEKDDGFPAFGEWHDTQFDVDDSPLKLGPTPGNPGAVLAAISKNDGSSEKSSNQSGVIAENEMTGVVPNPQVPRNAFNHIEEQSKSRDAFGNFSLPSGHPSTSITPDNRPIVTPPGNGVAAVAKRRYSMAESTDDEAIIDETNDHMNNDQYNSDDDRKMPATAQRERSPNPIISPDEESPIAEPKSKYQPDYTIKLKGGESDDDDSSEEEEDHEALGDVNGQFSRNESIPSLYKNEMESVLTEPTFASEQGPAEASLQKSQQGSSTEPPYMQPDGTAGAITTYKGDQDEGWNTGVAEFSGRDVVTGNGTKSIGDSDSEHSASLLHAKNPGARTFDDSTGHSDGGLTSKGDRTRSTASGSMASNSAFDKSFGSSKDGPNSTNGSIDFASDWPKQAFTDDERSRARSRPDDSTNTNHTSSGGFPSFDGEENTFPSNSSAFPSVPSWTQNPFADEDKHDKSSSATSEKGDRLTPLPSSLQSAGGTRNTHSARPVQAQDLAENARHEVYQSGTPRGGFDVQSSDLDRDDDDDYTDSDDDSSYQDNDDHLDDEENNTDDSLDIEEAIAFAAAAQQRLDNDNASMDQSLNRSVARSLDDMDGSFGPTQTVNKIEVGLGHQVPETLLPEQRHNERRTDDNQFHSIKHSSKKASSDEPTRIEESPYGMTETDNEGSSSSNSNDSNPVSTNDDDSSDSDSDDSSSSSSSGSDSGSSSDSSVEGTGVDDHQSYFTSGTAGKGLLSNPAEFQRQKQIRIEVEELVRELVPEEIDNLDAMFTQFAGREEELLNTLHTMKERRLKVRARAAVHKGKARPPPREHEQPGYKRNPSLRGQFSGTDTSAQILSASIPDSSDDTGSYSSSSSESSSSSSSSYSSSDSGSGS